MVWDKNFSVGVVRRQKNHPQLGGKVDVQSYFITMTYRPCEWV